MKAFHKLYDAIEIANRQFSDMECGAAVFIDEGERCLVGEGEDARRRGVHFHGDVEIADGGNLEGILRVDEIDVTAVLFRSFELNDFHLPWGVGGERPLACSNQ